MSLEKLCPLVKPATGENARAGEVVGIRSGCGDRRATRAGWILGDFPTHERFVRDLVADSGFTAVFVNYSPSPEARYPTAINEGYAATKWVAENGNDVLRDEGEAYARKLDAADVDVTAVRYEGLIHDYGLLNALSQIPHVTGTSY